MTPHDAQPDPRRRDELGHGNLRHRIGYRADVKGNVASFTLGYSPPIEFLLPAGIDMKIDKQTHIVLTGYDRQLLGQVAANMRALRPPDPYKNKGVRYTGEALRKKVGKTGSGGK